MNSRQVTVLWIIVVVLGLAAALVKINRDSSASADTARKSGDTLFEDFPGADVASLTITDANGSITLKKKGEDWFIADLDDYPALGSNVLALLRALDKLEVVQAIEAGPKLAKDFVEHFGIDRSDKKSPKDVSVSTSFSDASGKEIARVSLGRILENGGRFVLNHNDESGFYAVNDLLLMFDTATMRWIDQSFIQPEKISSIRVADADSPASKLWHVARDSEEDDFRLADAAPGEMLDLVAAEAMKTLMGFARFQDVVPAAKVEARTADTAKPRIATVETFEGFTYTFTIAPASVPEMPLDPDTMPPASDDQLLTIAVEATLPTERKKADEEPEEAAAALDQAFQERLATLTARLEKEQAMAGRTFVVAHSVVAPLLQQRDDITADPPEPTAATEAPAPAPAPAAPDSPGRVTVTTPPIEIPAFPAQDDEE